MNFRDLEKGASKSCFSEDVFSPLTDWYIEVRDVPLIMLSVGDICRALRQDLFVAHILPVAMAMLDTDVLAGEKYDGELIVALSGLDQKYWQDNKCTADQAIGFLAEAKRLSKDLDLVEDISTLEDLILKARSSS